MRSSSGAEMAVSGPLAGEARSVDVGEVNGEFFVNTPRLEFIHTWFLNENGGDADRACPSGPR